MALIVDQQAGFKHYCKICKKGFGCGRALGGHMRAHGIGDDTANQMEEEDPTSDCEDKLPIGSNNVAPTIKRMYELRTNPNRLKTTRACENCGKEFFSWKSFLEHENGKCTSNDVDSQEGEEYGPTMRGSSSGGWYKRKRSFRAKVEIGNSNYNTSNEEEDLAKCLMMLSNATTTMENSPLVVEPEESCASASKDEDRRNSTNFITPDTNITYHPTIVQTVDKAKGTTVSKGMFECKACKKVFNSHQALGGHRASHKKVKGCFAARLDHNNQASIVDDIMVDDDVVTTQHDDTFMKVPSSSFQFDHGSQTIASPSKRKSKVHECSICHRVFSSGQALGGHKRCHWITSNSPTADASSLAAKFHQFQDHIEQIQHRPPKFISTSSNSDSLDLTLDLNLPMASAVVVDHPNQARKDHLRHPPPPSGFALATGVYLQPWMGKGKKLNHNDEERIKKSPNKNNENANDSATMQKVDDIADSKVKLAKLSELKDIRINGNSSPWLQVGIGSTANVGVDH
ncbi:unnamed protein product [Linum tenue]|uniref:C2H2-type domain-containing protein n=1 Tax=Linum tenue TaxID=586396 RepID=A0AAV0HEK1_9ROSI|nr:unnamed protein product [Linum tenue]